MNIDYSLIGVRVKERRRKKNLTQEMLAYQLGVTVGYVSQIERGTSHANLKMLAQVANILECDVTDLITDSNTSNASYLVSDIFSLTEKLTNEERSILHHLLSAYIDESEQRRKETKKEATSQ